MAVVLQRGMHFPVSFGSKNAIREYCERSIPARFEEIVRRYPHRLAVKMGERMLTYKELNRYANRIANAIVAERGYSPEPVALCFNPGVDLVAAIFAVLKSGKFYVALDPESSGERLRTVLEDCGTKLVLADDAATSLTEWLSGSAGHTRLMGRQEFTSESDADLCLSIAPDAYASLTYTSGSTGHPKGVIETHRYRLHDTGIHSVAEDIGVHDTLSLVHRVAFASASIHLFRSLLNGASLTLWDAKDAGLAQLPAWLENEKITVLHLTPAGFRNIRWPDWRAHDSLALRLLHLSGAPITSRDFELYRSHFSPKVRLGFHLGSTESGGITSAVIDQTFSFPTFGTPAGYPMTDKEVTLVDENGQPVNPGEVGEIAVESQYLTAGYWKRPDLTGRKFVATQGRLSCYRTGDMASVSPDGFIVHHGRKDLMVKVRGFRVELGDIERTLLEHPTVAEATVSAFEDDSEDKYLVAYVVPRDDESPSVSEIKGFLRTKLPEYMTPASVVFLRALPLINGKLDRAALPKPDHRRPDLDEPYVAPRNELERRLSRVWTEALRLDDLGVNDNFFDLGGHSLAGARIVTRTKELFGVELTVGDLLASPTVGGLAERILSRKPGDSLCEANVCSQARLEEPEPMLGFQAPAARQPPTIHDSADFSDDQSEQSIPKQFEKIVGMYPHRLAVKIGERTLTYEELNRHANRIARAILDRRGGGSEPIALLLDHGIDIIAAILAVLKAGKFYIAIDSSFPSARNQHILGDSGAKLLVTSLANHALAAQLEPIPSSLLIIDDLGDGFSGDNVEIDISPEDRSSIQYTSGSTGRPKGVTELHRNLLHSLKVMRRELGITIDDRIALVHSLAFASAHTDLIVALLTGASLFPFDVKSQGVHAFAAWLHSEGITVCHLPPVMFRQLANDIRDPETVRGLRSIRLSGAPVFKSDFDLYKRHFPAETRLRVSMGTTETRGICSAVIDKDFAFPQEGFPVGYAKPGMKIRIVDDEKNEVAPGDVGEIAVEGIHLNPGYWKEPKKGSGAFAARSENSERLYFTGDLGRMLPDGLVVHLGRKDLIVKVRGYRVNMGEVENALLQHPDIQEAGIAAWDSELGDKYLAGYLVSRQGSAINVSDLNAFLRNRLPAYMIPSTFVPLDALPLTNGKLDRRALPKPQHKRPALGAKYLAPTSQIEEKLAGIWAEALPVGGVGIDDNFFDLGGNSLAGTSVVARVKEVFGVELSAGDLLQWPTVRELSQEIARRDVTLAAPLRQGNAVPSTQLCSKTGLEQSIPEAFEKIVRQFPGRVAIKDGSRQVTYAELNEMANRVAHSLKARESKEIEALGILIEKGVEQFAAMLGVLKCGKFFVLLDPAWPTVRTLEILKDSGARLLLSNDRHARKLDDASGRVPQVILIEKIDPAVSRANLDCMIAPNRCACLTYTTGSTGKPKGVILSHRSVMHRVVLRTNKGEVLAQDRVALLPSGTSNAISTAFQALLNGAALYPFDVKKEGVDRLATWLDQEKISVCFISSTLFRSLCQVLRGDDNFPHLRFLRLRSETSTPGDVRLFRRLFSRRCVLVHSLSSSETGPLCEYPIDNQTDLQADELPIGFVEPDKEILLLNDDGNDVGCNRVGEIAVRSRFLSPGYWRRPDLNRTKFRLDRPSRSRLYFTGDLAVRLPDGCLIHKGRKDRRVKIRGYGVDLQEIEKCLRRHPAVKEAVVLITNNDLGEPGPVAYFTLSGELPTTSDLRRFLSETIPDYMIPARFIRVQAWPLTPNGKVDRMALPVPDDQRPLLSRPFAPARNQIERLLVTIWEEVLGTKPVGINDDFFDLGGDSLKLARMLSRINEELRIDLSPGDFLTGAQIAALGPIIDAKARVAHESGKEQEISRYVVNLRAGAGDKRIFCFPYRGGFHDEYFNFCRISRHFPSEFSFYGLRARGVNDGDRPRETIKQIAQDFIEAIRSVQPHGPYVFVGECGGGIPAFETARQLEALGEPVELLVLFDTQAWPFREYIGRRLKEPFTYRKRLGLLPPGVEYLDKRLQYHLDRMKQLRGSGRIHYLLAKCIQMPKLVALHVGGGGIKNRLSPSAGSTASVPPISRPRISEKDYFIAAHRYRYRPYRGRIALLVNEEWHRRKADLNWRRFAKGRFDVYPIPGDHDHCVPDNIPRVAEILREIL